MELAENRGQLWSFTRPWKKKGLKSALVPTMGNLHDGHLALVKAAREHADRVVTSIYVNPAQFGEGEDFDSYPRTLESDLRKLETAGCDLAFVPDNKTMYPWGPENGVRLLAARGLSTILEGASRPGHFDGVVTVVARLFNLVCPDVAVFGEKDYQQLLVIRRLVEDLGYRIKIVPLSTVRESGGLAMSSRNNYLDTTQRKAAGQLNRILQDTADRAAVADTKLDLLEHQATVKLEAQQLRVDYLAFRRASDLEIPKAGDRALRLLAAVWCGQTRLIDNLPVN